MNFWIDLFSGTTWEEFRRAGANTTGFRISQSKPAKSVKNGDVFLCYLTGVMRWVGALEVTGPSKDNRPIWKEQEFPVRFSVKPLVLLDPEHGVPMSELEGRVSFFAGPGDRGKFKGLVRRSPNLIRTSGDGESILDLLLQSQKNPVIRPVDLKKLSRGPLYKAERRQGKVLVSTVVSVPEPEFADKMTGSQDSLEDTVASTRHTEIQFHLLNLGAEMGLDVWVAKNDRSRSWRGRSLSGMPRMVTKLPTQFNDATRKTIELIDVLWLKGNTFVAAFEVECTTAVYSGLLRMSDLLALQPNLDIKLYLVAPDERRKKVEEEILRPTFKLRERPLFETCGFLAFSILMEKVEGIRKLGLASSLRPDFLEQTAEFFKEDETQ